MKIVNKGDGIPHVMIGVPNRDVGRPKDSVKTFVDRYESRPKPLFNEKEDNIIQKIQKWGLVICVSVVVIYALWRMFA